MESSDLANERTDDTGNRDGPRRVLPTAVVARTAKPGREREFERWLKRLLSASRDAPGNVRATVQTPNPQHPNEWVVVYQFHDPESRQRWLESKTRLDLMSQGADLCDGPAREQVIALSLGSNAEPVTAVVSFRVDPELQDQFEDRYNEMINLIRSFPGFLRCEHFEPVDGVQDESVVVFAFSSRDQLDRWLESDERRKITDSIAPLLIGDTTVNVVGGFGGWFGGGGMAPTKSWKQAVVVLLALYPMVLGLTWIDREFGPDIAWPLSILWSNIVGVAILTWITMPWLTRRLRSWLSS